MSPNSFALLLRKTERGSGGWASEQEHGGGSSLSLPQCRRANKFGDRFFSIRPLFFFSSHFSPSIRPDLLIFWVLIACINRLEHGWGQISMSHKESWGQTTHRGRPGRWRRCWSWRSSCRWVRHMSSLGQRPTFRSHRSSPRSRYSPDSMRKYLKQHENVFKIWNTSWWELIRSLSFSKRGLFFWFRSGGRCSVKDTPELTNLSPIDTYYRNNNVDF